MGPLTGRVAGSRLLTTAMAIHLKRRMKMIEEHYLLTQGLQERFFETTYPTCNGNAKAGSCGSPFT